MPTTIEQGDIFGRIGKAVGQGVGEQVERGQLARRLKEIKGFPEGAANIISAPEGKETIPYALPYLQNQLDRENYLKGTKPAEKIPSLAGAISTVSEKKPELENTFSEMSLDEKRAHPEYLTKLSPERYQEEVGKVLLQYPNYSPIQAESIVDKKEATRLGEEQSFENRRDLTDKEFYKLVEKATQKGGERLYGDVTGAMQNEFLEKIYAEVDAGKKTPHAAAKQAAEKLLSFAESKQNLRSLGSMARLFKPSETKKSLESIREKYKDFGKLKDFKDDLVSYQGLSEPYADAIAYPVNSNKEINNIVYSAKSRTGGLINRTKQAFSGSPEREIADKISPLIKPTDSLLSIALSLKGKSFNPIAFMDQMRKNYRDGKVSLDSRQIQEFEKGANFSPSLADNFLYAWSGLNPIEEQK